MNLVVLAACSLVLRTAWVGACAAGGTLGTAGDGAGGTCVVSASVTRATAVTRALSSATSAGVAVACAAAVACALSSAVSAG